MKVTSEVLDMEYGMSECIRLMREELLRTIPEICIERARIYTRVYQENKADPSILRRAKALAKTLEEMSIFIYCDELLVGNQASKVRGAPIFPEYSWEWIVEEADQFHLRKGDVF